MKKKVILRSLAGVPVGVFLTVTVAVFISCLIGDGEFHFVSDNLINECGTELNAVLRQFAVVIFYGAVWGASSVIWEQETWSILKQLAVHYTITVVSTILAAVMLFWVERNLIAVAVYLIIFTAIYIFIWTAQILSMKAKIKKLNSKFGG